MTTKRIIKALALSLIIGAASVTSASSMSNFSGLSALSSNVSVVSNHESLGAFLENHPENAYKCFCTFDFRGKTQLAACLRMAKIFEQELSENENDADVPLSDVFQGFVGIDYGSMLATAMALGQKTSDVYAVLSQLPSKMVTPVEVTCCLGCLGKTTQLASYLIDGNDPIMDSPGVENNYDAIKLDDADSVTAISNLTSGGEADLKSCLTVLSTSTSENFSEQVMAAMNESDNAAKANAMKIAFDTILDAAQTATSAAITLGGDHINSTAAGKALDIMTKVEDGSEKFGKSLENANFKRNLVQNLVHPTSETPIILVNFKAETSNETALKTIYRQELGENLVKITYTTKIPVGYYPSKKVPFELVNANIESSVSNCMQSIRLDSAKATDILVDKLTAIKLAKLQENSPDFVEENSF